MIRSKKNYSTSYHVSKICGRQVLLVFLETISIVQTKILWKFYKETKEISIIFFI
jgi:hypothetical protein